MSLAKPAPGTDVSGRRQRLAAVRYHVDLLAEGREHRADDDLVDRVVLGHQDAKRRDPSRGRRRVGRKTRRSR
ncbi:MAG: hypothetical protein GY856_02470 [bacterium]|nr:hypothetical protein [bacterium]